jgi:transposase-like protein
MKRINGIKIWTPADKKEYTKPSFALKKKIIQQVINGQITIHRAAIKYNVCRSSIDYWLKKFTTLEEAEGYMEKDKELKKLQQRIQELEWIKEFQQDLIAEFELTTGKALAKKYLPEHLAKEIERKKKAQKK